MTLQWHRQKYARGWRANGKHFSYVLVRVGMLKGKPWVLGIYEHEGKQRLGEPNRVFHPATWRLGKEVAQAWENASAAT